jgi:hypothetical protein
MNPYVAEALAALQAKGYSKADAQAIIDRFLAANPNDEHRLFAALDLGSSSVTGQQLLAAAQQDAELANKAYVRNLIPANLTTDEFFHPSSATSATPMSGGGGGGGWLGLVIPLALVAGAAYFFWKKG